MQGHRIVGLEDEHVEVGLERRLQVAQLLALALRNASQGFELLVDRGRALQELPLLFDDGARRFGSLARHAAMGLRQGLAAFLAVGRDF